MADETPPPDPDDRPALRAGQPLDLSTGKPAPPPSEPDRPTFTPLPAREGDPEVRAGRTVDFSTGKAAAPRRKSAAASLGAGPVVRETLDLSTARPEPAEAAAPAEPAASGAPRRGAGGSGKPKRSGEPKGGQKRGRPKPTGNSLAELLDPETLARLRGGA
jgi:hypothetical protein